MTTPSSTDNPFVDPASSVEQDATRGRGNSSATDSTIAVGKNASLTLGTDSLIVLGKESLHCGVDGMLTGWQTRLSRRKITGTVVDSYPQVCPDNAEI
jgi:hypothetical protein